MKKLQPLFLFTMLLFIGFSGVAQQNQKTVYQKKNIEREKKIKEQQEVYERTDAGSIKKSIKESFDEWNQKGEFEKVADYDLRLKNKSQEAFLQICTEQIKNRVGSFNSDDLEKELSIYDSEKELFTVTFKRKGVKWQNVLKIPIADAANFKSKWSDLECKIDDFDWCFVENSLCPTLITLIDKEDNSKYKLPLLLNNQFEITFSFDEFGIANQYLKEFVFKYSNAKSIAEQNEKVYETAEQMPQFPGGEVELLGYINKNLKYPVIAQENGIQGKVILRFVVSKTGDVDGVEVVRSLDSACDKEATRIVKSLPKFIPWKQNGVEVAVWYTFPVAFKLE